MDEHFSAPSRLTSSKEPNGKFKGTPPQKIAHHRYRRSGNRGQINLTNQRGDTYQKLHERLGCEEQLRRPTKQPGPHQVVAKRRGLRVSFLHIRTIPRCPTNCLSGWISDGFSTTSHWETTVPTFGRCQASRDFQFKSCTFLAVSIETCRYESHSKVRSLSLVPRAKIRNA